MDIDGNDVKRHYGRGHILESIMRALRDMHKDVSSLSPADLALVDEFHTRGRAATIDLARRAALTPGLNVLDVGCGLGGSARYLASEHGCRVTGIDLTKEYVDAANALAELVSMKDLVTFHQASALNLPFSDASFDAVWTQHVQMNISDKRAFYGQIARVLVPRGRLLFHDVFQGPGGLCTIPSRGQRTPRSVVSRLPRGYATSWRVWASRSSTGTTRASCHESGSSPASRR